jgi:hypothetical protein
MQRLALDGETCDLVPARLGLWTPHADVCCAAHYAVLDHENATAVPREGAPRGWRDLYTPSGLYLELTSNWVPPGDGWGVTQCDQCLRPVWVRGDVAELWNFASAVGQFADVTSGMMQTGGMCAALRVKLERPDPDTLAYPADMRWLGVTHEDGFYLFLCLGDPYDGEEGDGLCVARGVSYETALALVVALAAEGAETRGRRL